MEYLEHQRSIAPFWGGEDYLAPGEASAHVSNKGRNFFKKHLSSADHMLIGDLGCWCGRHVGILLELARGGRVVGIDHSTASPRVMEAQRRHPEATYKIADLTQRLPLADGDLSGVLCWRVLHNIHWQGGLLRAQQELFRILKPEAPVVMAVRAPTKDMLAEGLISEYSKMPRVLRTFTAVNDRVDIYFTKPSIEAVFGYRFQVEEVELIEESEVIDGLMFTHPYWAVHMLRRDNLPVTWPEESDDV